MLGQSTATHLVLAATAPAEPSARKRTAPPVAPITRVGTILAGKYRIDALLGEGGCGRVYKATHLALQGSVAIKFLLPAYTSHEVLRERFSREARLLARLCHPGIAAAHDYGEDNGELYLVMEYVAGRQLGLLMLDHQQSGIPIPRIVSITEQILDVLAAAHASAITHRDIKPSNIMLYQDDGGTERLKLLDFGLAFIEDRKRQPRLTGNGQVVGTVFYMAPEQCRGQDVGPPADIYSLGVVLYQMLSGHLPFSGKTPLEVMAQHVRSTPPPLAKLELHHAIPPRLAELAMWALEKSPAARPTAIQFRHALRRAVEDSQKARRDSLSIAPIVCASAPSMQAAASEAKPSKVGTSAPTIEAVVVEHEDSVSWPVVMLWGFSEERASRLRRNLAPHRIEALTWPVEDLPPADLEQEKIQAILVPGDAQATDRLGRLRKGSEHRKTPVLVSDVTDAAMILPLIRAGASDMVLEKTPLEQLSSQVVRLIRRGR